MVFVLCTEWVGVIRIAAKLYIPLLKRWFFCADLLFLNKVLATLNLLTLCQVRCLQFVQIFTSN